MQSLADPAQLFVAVPDGRGRESDRGRTYTLAVTAPEAVAPDLRRALVATGADVLSIGDRRHSLEDVSLERVDESGEAAAR